MHVEPGATCTLIAVHEWAQVRVPPAVVCVLPAVVLRSAVLAVELMRCVQGCQVQRAWGICNLDRLPDGPGSTGCAKCTCAKQLLSGRDVCLSSS